MNKPKLVPSCEDVMKVQTLLEKKMKSDDYVTVIKSTLCAISLFNRKRGGELQRMKVEDYRNSKIGSSTNPDLLKGLTETEKKMVQYFHRVEIRGKLNRPVPILLTKSAKASLERILILRKEVLTLTDSPYIFATPTGERPYRGHDVLKEFALQAEVSNPAIFTFTQLRKQIATLAQAMAISELDQDQLATFLGHDIRIHRHIYRQPQEILQKAKVAKILLSANNGLTDFESCIQLELNDMDIDFDSRQSCDNGIVQATKGKLAVSVASGDSQDRDLSLKITSEYEDRDPPLRMTSGHQDRDPPLRMTSGQNKAGLQKRTRKEPLEFSRDDCIRSEDSAAPPLKKARQKRRQWTETERRAIHKHFGSYLLLNRLPGKAAIEQVLTKEEALQCRKWRNVKDYIHNLLEKQKVA